MLQTNIVLLTIIFLLTIVILAWIFVAAVLPKLGKNCLQIRENVSETAPIVNVDETEMTYSIETVQPEMKPPGNMDDFYEKPKMQKRLFESILSSQVDSADEMSFIYDVYSETESDQQRKTKAIASRFAKYLESVPGSEPVMLVLLHYNKNTENLLLAIIKIANLKILSNNKKPDPYVRIDIWIENMVKLKKKTVVIKQELNPVYNQKMEFRVSAKELESVKIILTIANYASSLSGSRRSRPASLHEVGFGQQSTGSFLEHWKAVIGTDKPVAKWHVLNKY